ncbi:hypothetical protein HYH03_009385 [Edaphochlamys debaryana]|uniref:Uncharacterized protein n=1 Tax=Edaphochlamys debaryana TaxID=47281 RepID=A0A835XZF8_9CHLO|nr:hypothetical protein HYH03_009385 [Edaphochlamys debaryana]|eukprot:KAG2492442.1 hypothetical protein HYH03_009385 [Edaphochlamys debaryana]
MASSGDAPTAVHQHAGGGHGLFFCSGEPLLTEGGSWIGHLMPGVVFVLWGLHWMQGIYRNYLVSRRQKGGEYRMETTHSLWRLPKQSEAICKTVLPLIAISWELYFAHKGGFRSLLCPAGYPRAGHFYGPHMTNWQHMAIYPAFVVSGVVDLVGFEVELPAGTQQVALFIAFMCEALLMGLHAKHLPLDIAVHGILFYTMLACAIMVLAELAYPASFLASWGRVAATLMQGVWFFAAAVILFEHRPAWDEAGGEDMAPAMMTPVVFVFCILLVVVFLFASYLAFHCWFVIQDARGASQYERTSALDEDPLEGHGPARAAFGAEPGGGKGLLSSSCGPHQV